MPNQYKHLAKAESNFISFYNNYRAFCHRLSVPLLIIFRSCLLPLFYRSYAVRLEVSIFSIFRFCSGVINSFNSLAMVCAT